LRVGQLAAVAVVAGGLPGGAGGLAAGVELLLGAVAAVGVPGDQQPGRDVPVEVHALGLAVRGVGAADLGALVPVEAQPAHRVEQLGVGLLGVAGRVGVLDAEDQGALVVLGERPVEQGGADQAHVGVSGGRGTETDAYGGRAGCASHA